MSERIDLILSNIADVKRQIETASAARIESDRETRDAINTVGRRLDVLDIKATTSDKSSDDQESRLRTVETWNTRLVVGYGILGVIGAIVTAAVVKLLLGAG